MVICDQCNRSLRRCRDCGEIYCECWSCECEPDDPAEAFWEELGYSNSCSLDHEDDDEACDPL